MKTARWWAGTGGAGLVALWLWWLLASPAGGGLPPVAGAGGREPAGAAAPGARPAPIERAAWAGLTPAPPEAADVPLPQAMVPVLLTAPSRLLVGEQTELLVGVGAHAAVGEIGFTIQFDPNVLQVRAGAPGEWATGDGPGTRFAVEIPEGADRVQIRSAAAGPRAGARGGPVALVQFEAVGPGTTTVTLTDVTARDRSGRAMPILLSMPTVHITAEAATLPAPGPQHAVVDAAAADRTAENGD